MLNLIQGRRINGKKITSVQLKLPLETVENFLISNAVTLTAKRYRNILELFRADKIRAAKCIPANLNFNVRYKQFSLSFH